MSADVTTLAVGSPCHDADSSIDQGEVFIFIRDGTTWSQSAILTQPVVGNMFGWGAALSADASYLAISAGDVDRPVYVSNRTGSVWQLQDTLIITDGESPNYVFGFPIADRKSVV